MHNFQEEMDFSKKLNSYDDDSYDALFLNKDKNNILAVNQVKENAIMSDISTDQKYVYVLKFRVNPGTRWTHQNNCRQTIIFRRGSRNLKEGVQNQGSGDGSPQRGPGAEEVWGMKPPSSPRSWRVFQN